MVRKLLKNVTLVILVGNRKATFTGVTIQLIEGKNPDVLLFGTDLCRRLGLTPLDQQVKNRIKNTDKGTVGTKRKARVNEDTDWLHPDFDERRDLLPEELRPWGVRVLKKGTEVARANTEQQWFRDALQLDTEDAEEIEEEIDAVAIPSLTDEEEIERKRSAEIEAMIERMEANAREAGASEEEIGQCEALLRKYEDIFHMQITRSMPPAKVEPMRVRIKKDARKFPNLRVRKYSPAQLRFMRTEIDSLIASGVLEPSTTEEACHCLVVSRPTALSTKHRLCVDYRIQNKRCEIEKHPLANIDLLVASAAGAKFYSQSDFAKGFWLAPVHEDSKRHLGLLSPFGVFVFTRCCFGFCNSPSYFARVLGDALCGLKNCLLYVDDLLLHSNEAGEMLEHMEAFFKRIREVGLYLNPKKSEFMTSKVIFAGHQVSRTGTRNDPRKTASI